MLDSLWLFLQTVSPMVLPFFKLDQRLEDDSVFVMDLQLSQLRLHKNASFPWLLLIPVIPNCSEIIDLDIQHQKVLLDEIGLASRIVKNLFSPDKINVGALGNIVNQLHVHVIGRKTSDGAWPGPVWGSGLSSSYSSSKVDELLHSIRDFIKNYFL